MRPSAFAEWQCRFLLDNILSPLYKISRPDAIEIFREEDSRLPADDKATTQEID